MSYKFFENKECEYYPCHDMDKQNCLACYCPLYLIDCGGNFKYTINGVKDCSECTKPHREENYDWLVKSIAEKCL